MTNPPLPGQKVCIGFRQPACYVVVGVKKSMVVLRHHLSSHKHIRRSLDQILRVNP